MYTCYKNVLLVFIRLINEFVSESFCREFQKESPQVAWKDPEKGMDPMLQALAVEYY